MAKGNQVSPGCCPNRNSKSGQKFSARFCDSEHLNSKKWFKEQMGSPIKGRVKIKYTTPIKKISFFRLALSSPQHGNFLSPFFAPVISFLSVLGQHIPIRTSHPSGSRRLCFRRDICAVAQCLKHGPWSIRTPENLRCHTVFNWFYHKSYGY